MGKVEIQRVKFYRLFQCIQVTQCYHNAYFQKCKSVPTRMIWGNNFGIMCFCIGFCKMLSSRNTRWTQKTTPSWTELWRNSQTAHMHSSSLDTKARLSPAGVTTSLHSPTPNTDSWPSGVRDPLSLISAQPPLLFFPLCSFSPLISHFSHFLSLFCSLPHTHIHKWVFFFKVKCDSCSKCACLNHLTHIHLCYHFY